jgi:hypothetical protein
MVTLLVLHIKKGTAFDPASLVGTHGHRYDHAPVDPDHPDGDRIAVFRANRAEARQTLEAQPGITVLPPLHRPIKEEHARAFRHVNAASGEPGYDIAERLHDHHRLHWLHPEEYDI